MPPFSVNRLIIISDGSLTPGGGWYKIADFKISLKSRYIVEAEHIRIYAFL
jgi:hypothetical protein